MDYEEYKNKQNYIQEWLKSLEYEQSHLKKPVKNDIHVPNKRNTSI